MKLIGKDMFAIDGCKMPSNASKEWSGTFSDLKKKQEALNRKVKEAILEHRETDKRESRKSDTDRQRFEKRIKKLKQKADLVSANLEFPWHIYSKPYSPFPLGLSPVLSDQGI
jgi:hypothetical protein